MALKSTIYKARPNIADMDRQVYGDFPLTLARHPSETDERMMLRLLAWALHADELLEFGRGISTDDEPDLWRKSLTGDIEMWIELGAPDPERLRKACGRADSVILYAYGDRAIPVWWDKHANSLSRLERLQVWQVPDQCMQELTELAAATMQLQCTIEGGEAWLSGDDASVHFSPQQLQG